MPLVREKHRLKIGALCLRIQAQNLAEFTVFIRVWFFNCRNGIGAGKPAV
jgi:hypothetical protein